MIGKIILIFIAGFIVDLLVTKYTDYVARKKRGKATAISGIITLAEFMLIAFIIKDISSNDYISILALASGNCLGTFWATKSI